MNRGPAAGPSRKPAISATPRLAVAGDVPAIAELCLEAARETGVMDLPAAALRRRVRKMMASDRTELVVAGRPAAAMAILHLKDEIWQDTKSAFVENLFVSAQQRGRGLGRAVMSAVIGIAVRRQVVTAYLNVNERNEVALRLYESFGFRASLPANWAGGREVCLINPVIAAHPPRSWCCDAADHDHSDRDGIYRDVC